MVREAMRRLGVLLAVTLAVAACTNDDDADETTVPATTPSSTESPTTDAPTTTDARTTTEATTTTAAPTTTVDVEALKAQIAADYERSAELLDELVSSPTLEGLDERSALIMAPDTEAFNGVKEFVQGMVERGEHVVNGEPDYSTTTVEGVELVGSPPYTQAVVTSCVVTNRARVDSQGIVQEGTGILGAIREQSDVALTANGWLPSSSLTSLGEVVGGTECPPA